MAQRWLCTVHRPRRDAHAFRETTTFMGTHIVLTRPLRFRREQTPESRTCPQLQNYSAKIIGSNFDSPTDGLDQPIPYVRYVVVDPGGTEFSGHLDEQGFARVEPVKAGRCSINFPELGHSTAIDSCRR